MAEGGADIGSQKSFVTKELQKNLVKGDAWFLLDAKWFKQWKKYVGYDEWDQEHAGDATAMPGPINNSSLFKDSEGDDEKLREHMVEELDYVLVPELVWKNLVRWFDIISDEHEVKRHVIEQGVFVKQCKVEVYRMKVNVYVYGKPSDTKSLYLSRADPVENIKTVLKGLFNVDESKETNVWYLYYGSTLELLKPDKTLQDSGLYAGQTLILEVENDDGTWPYKKTVTTAPRVQAGSSNDNFSVGNSYTTRSASYQRSTPGLCGLSNLGNTCFMNSALQCMSNVPLLTKYFLSPEWREELNPDNPLGMKGRIAHSFAELINVMWSGSCSQTTPRNFKLAVGQFAPQFMGYQQHDSQELMAFLLDGLHEDLNRIKKKPYVELKEADGREDSVVAAEAWENYKKRNDSIVTDLFHGQLKSRLECPKCNKVSVTFDPFCYLSVPLPQKKERLFQCYFVRADMNVKPLLMKLTVPKYGNIRLVLEALVKHFNDVEIDQLTVADVYQRRFYKVYNVNEAITSVGYKDEIYIYEHPKTPPGCTVFPVYLRGHDTYGYPQLFGKPFLVALSNSYTEEEQYNACLDRLKGRLLNVPEETDNWWEEEQQQPHTSNGETHDNEESRRRLFDVVTVNSTGSNIIKKMRDSEPTYFALEWKAAALKFFNSEEVDAREVHSTFNKCSTRSVGVSLRSCLELFCEKEQLGQDDPWYCPSCEEHVEAYKKFDLWSLPKYLVIHLKRFSYTRWYRDKIDSIVDFPIRDFDLREMAGDSISKELAVYDLVAVSNHYGGMGGGHYTAYGRNEESHDWFYFDDSSVSKSSSEKVVTSAAYVLVYQRKDVSGTVETMDHSETPQEADDMDTLD